MTMADPGLDLGVGGESERRRGERGRAEDPDVPDARER